MTVRRPEAYRVLAATAIFSQEICVGEMCLPQTLDKE